MLFGEHAVVYGKPCIVTAVNQRISVTVSHIEVEEFVLDAPDLGLQSYKKDIKNLCEAGIPKSVAFLEHAVRLWKEKFPFKGGIQVTTKSDFSSLFGFGSSSAVTVSCVTALSQIFHQTLSKKELFDIAFQAVLAVQGVGSGFDLAAALWGGTLIYKTPAAIVEPLHLGTIHIVVGYTGIKADTPTIVRMVEKQRQKNRKNIDAMFTQIEDIVHKASEAITLQQAQKVGTLMNENQKILDELGVSSKELDALIHASIKAGAYGAKLSGAGGGDCMIACCSVEKMKHVENAIQEAGGVVMRVQLEAQGAV